MSLSWSSPDEEQEWQEAQEQLGHPAIPTSTNPPAAWNWAHIKGWVIHRGFLLVHHVPAGQRAALAEIAGEHDLRIVVLDALTIRIEVLVLEKEYAVGPRIPGVPPKSGRKRASRAKLEE